MLFAASESAVTKRPRLRLTMRRSSSVRPFGSFQSWMSRLMLISCGIQWFAQAAMYFSQAHLYLKGTSWLTSALELMTCLSSTLTRRRALGAGGAWRASRGSGEGVLSGARFSKLSMGLFVLVVVAHRLREQHRLQARRFLRGGGMDELGAVLARQRAERRLALRCGRERHLVGGEVQVPVGAGDAHPLGVPLVVLQQVGRKILRLAEMDGAERQQPPARHQDCVNPRTARRRP